MLSLIMLFIAVVLVKQLVKYNKAESLQASQVIFQDEAIHQHSIARINAFSRSF
ncbi:hypothetical protein VQ643_09675 [Pseudomonas sp. F1_0610]|uniref:hypothetical protein n=1 Tax=Pseudomonas sp. F1_0610 TaxID=3114284 RepID=UPI0039C27C74